MKVFVTVALVFVIAAFTTFMLIKSRKAPA